MDYQIGNYVTIDNKQHHPRMKDVPLEIFGLPHNSNGLFAQLKLITEPKHEYCERYSQLMEHVKPILLDENWFKDFYFVRQPWGWVKDTKKDSEIGVLIHFQTKPYLCASLNVGNGLRSEFTFVHELQNLYFALTREKLTLINT